ncbi:hypothetical protein F5Y10DRAFT_75528 [Nemania abortiva]|nr:hypothetical protein F5Y10DRAFT_75528 [Nemania abortiva]
MAPKRGLQQPKTKPSSSKRPRLSGDALTKKTVSSSRRGRPKAEVYSPNIDTSDFSEPTTEDDEEPQNALFADPDGTVDKDDDEDAEGDLPAAAIPYGKSAREIRADRRAAKQDEVFTDDDEVEIEEPAEEAALGSDADAEGEEIYDELFGSATFEIEEAPEDATPDVGPTAEGEDVKEDRTADDRNGEAEAAEDAGGSGAAEPVPVALRSTYAAPSYYTTSEESSSTGDAPAPAPAPAPTPAPAPASGAEARYREFMLRRLGQWGLPPVRPQTPRPSRYMPVDPNMFQEKEFSDGLYDSSSPSSSSSSSSASSVRMLDNIAPPRLDRPVFPSAPSSSSSSSSGFPSLEELRMDHNQLGNSLEADGDGVTTMDLLNMGAESELPFLGMEEVEEELDTNDEGSYIVSRRDKLLDGFLSIQLRKIGRALNFMVRAKATGIDVEDFDALAAVDPEKWNELVDTPETAAEIVVDAMLQMSFWDIVILSKRATMLLDELSTLGITI